MLTPITLAYYEALGVVLDLDTPMAEETWGNLCRVAKKTAYFNGKRITLLCKVDSDINLDLYKISGTLRCVGLHPGTGEYLYDLVPDGWTFDNERAAYAIPWGININYDGTVEIQQRAFVEYISLPKNWPLRIRMTEKVIEKLCAYLVSCG